MTAKDFEKIEKLYHYTTFESAWHILTNQTLLFGALPDMNDIYEQHKQIGFNYNSNLELNNLFYKELGKYKQISFTIDDKRKGFDIPAMWGHYAAKGNGVCLVFDKNKILERISDNLYFHGRITYNKDSNNVIVVNDVHNKKGIRPFLDKNKLDIFMSKTEDWSYEQEYRIVTNDRQAKSLDIQGCVICALYRARTNEESDVKQAILDILKCKSYRYSNFYGSISLQNDDEQIYPFCRFATREEWLRDMKCQKCTHAMLE